MGFSCREGGGGWPSWSGTVVGGDRGWINQDIAWGVGAGGGERGLGWGGGGAGESFSGRESGLLQGFGKWVVEGYHI